MSDFVIRELHSEDSITELTDLLHVAYLPGAKMGIHFFAATQTEEHTRERIRRAHATYVATQAQKIVGTISLYRAVPDHRCEHYRTAWWFGQFGVLPSVQRGGLGSRLMEVVEQRAIADGAPILALDTAETAEELIAFYRKRGFAFVQYQQWPDVKHRSVVLSKPLRKS